MEQLPFNPYRSTEIDKIVGALSKAQGAYKQLIPDTNSPRGKFASLRAILSAVKDAIATNGLAFWQDTFLLDEGTGANLLITTLGHESGQYIGSCARVVAGKTDRRTGNIIEIHKRLQAQMLLGIAPSEHDPIAFDDDGEEISEENIIEKVRKGKPSEDIRDRDTTISQDQYNELMIELDGYPELTEDILECYTIETLADLPREEYHKTRARVVKIKRTEEEYRMRK